MIRKWLILSACVLCACQAGTSEERAASGDQAVEDEAASYDSFGDPVTPAGAIDINDALARLGELEGEAVKVTGMVSSVCQKKGCWMALEVAEGEDVMVRFKDYGFFVPMDCAGSEVVLDGVLKTEEQSVETLRHLAEDAGKPPEEIAEITEPATTTNIIASGVLVRAGS